MFLKPPHKIKFDPNNPEHRKAVKNFLKRNAWSDTHLRFSHDPAYDSMAEQVKSKLLNWYLTNELSTIKE